MIQYSDLFSNYTPYEEDTYIEIPSIDNAVDLLMPDFFQHRTPTYNNIQIENTISEEEPEEIIIQTPQVRKTVSSDSSLLRIDIEDLLKSEGITSVNGKKIKFGNKNLRPQNASFGAKNSYHKKRDPHTGNAMARDISIIRGSDKDYADFRKILLNNNRVRSWMQTKGWGIINEITPQILARTKGTGPHFHFGRDTWARRTWRAWLNNPNIDITKAL